MTQIENLHYAIGQLAYAVANIDGKVQKEEKDKFREIVEAELRCNDYAFNVSDIIFQILSKDKNDSETTYKWAMDQIKENSHYLSPLLKAKFIKVMVKVAKAFPPITNSEQQLIERFKKDIAELHGDPIFYEKAY